MNSVYITRVSKFLPNEAVTNEEMENYLGKVNNQPSRAKSIVLRNNGIKTRYYSLKKDGSFTHTNAELAAEAIKSLFDDEVSIDQLEVLGAGTTMPDQLLPSHASMIHGLLGHKNLELISAQGACASSIQALKYAFLSIAMGEAKTAAVVGSERFSNSMQASRFEPEAENLSHLENNGFIAFEKDFLRWMLSDGASAVLLQNQPNQNDLSLKIDWIELSSFADQLPTCMYAGATQNEDMSLNSWNDMPTEEWEKQSVMALKQDTRLLGDNIVPRGGDFLASLMKKRNLSSEDIDLFLPHMSSMFFKDQVQKNVEKIGLPIPHEKWFFNLTEVGNVGSASPFLMLEEVMRNKMIKKGEHILVMVPESARFSYAYIYLTAV